MSMFNADGFEINVEIITYVKEDGKEIANFSASARSTGDAVNGLARATAPALADALATSSRMLKAVKP
jgi:xanthine dehydrogenase molybdopterin-binding subunit B